MNQNNPRNKNYKCKIFLYMLLGIGFEIPAAFYCINNISYTRRAIYWNLGCSFLFMFFYLIHYSLKEYKRSKSSRLNRKWGFIFLAVFCLNLFDFCIIFKEVISSDWADDPKKNNEFIFIFLLIISLTQSIVTTIDFLITFVKFVYNLIRNHRINSEIQQDLLNAATQNNVIGNNNNNNNNRSINNDIRIGLISGSSDFESQNFAAADGLEKFRVSNRIIIAARKEDEECTICLEFVMENSNDNYALKIPCGHYFHFRCLNSLLSVNKKCPNCRQLISGV